MKTKNSILGCLAPIFKVGSLFKQNTGIIDDVVNGSLIIPIAGYRTRQYDINLIMEACPIGLLSSKQVEAIICWENSSVSTRIGIIDTNLGYIPKKIFGLLEQNKHMISKSYVSSFSKSWSLDMNRANITILYGPIHKNKVTESTLELTRYQDLISD